MDKYKSIIEQVENMFINKRLRITYCDENNVIKGIKPQETGKVHAVTFCGNGWISVAYEDCSLLFNSQRYKIEILEEMMK